MKIGVEYISRNGVEYVGMVWTYVKNIRIKNVYQAGGEINGRKREITENEKESC